MGLVDVCVRHGIATVRFNNPKKLNAWTLSLMRDKNQVFKQLADDGSVDAVVVTGTGEYYSSGVDLNAVLRPMHPKKLVSQISEMNQELFTSFIDFPKPIIAAVNGPAIGAAATSLRLFDAVYVLEKATFQTPFASLGLVPEGCSSYLFPKDLGQEISSKMLQENYKLDAFEAVNVGFANEIIDVNREEFENCILERAQAYLEKNGQNRVRFSNVSREKLHEVNRYESQALAEAFVSPRFLLAMEGIAEKRRKTSLMYSFKALRLTRPVWSLLL
mmetsp:Transcript_6623/g.11708  ORF Transcript_6623/g.11708 Transcript_6623/m.11708 type:complete len:274 (+) Transcript_6623:534-1355(+)